MVEKQNVELKLIHMEDVVSKERTLSNQICWLM